MKNQLVILTLFVALIVVTLVGVTGSRPDVARAYPYLSVACAQAELRAACESGGDDDIHAYGVAHGNTGFSRWVSRYTNPDGVVYLRFTMVGGTDRTVCAKSWRTSDTSVPDAIYAQWSGSFCDVYRARFTDF